MDQVDSDGDVRLVSGVGGKGTSYMTLSGRTGLGPNGALRLADLLRESPPQMLSTLCLRQLLLFVLKRLKSSSSKHQDSAV